MTLIASAFGECIMLISVRHYPSHIPWGESKETLKREFGLHGRTVFPLGEPIGCDERQQEAFSAFCGGAERLQFIAKFWIFTQILYYL